MVFTFDKGNYNFETIDSEKKTVHQILSMKRLTADQSHCVAMD
jgi:hypothetical protein